MASSSRLKLGEKGEIITKVDTKGRVGSISKIVKVFSNDPKRPEVTLVIKAMIR